MLASRVLMICGGVSQPIGKTMKNISKAILAMFATALISCALCTQQAQATPISGEIDMSGTAVLDSQFLGSATKMTSASGVTVGGVPTGSFAGTFGDSVTWNSFGWNPFFTGTPTWTFTDAGTGWTYSFLLSGITVEEQNNHFLNLEGSGTLSIVGPGSPYSPTQGEWSFTISNPGGGGHSNFSFTFANSQTAVAPDGGSAVALLGIALAGIGGARRMFRARKT